jgi:phosphoribosylformylglycinamidine synthase
MGGRLGLDIDLDKVPQSEPCSAAQLLFSESNTRFVMTVSPENAAKVEELLEGIPFSKVGTVTSKPVIEFSSSDAGKAEIQLEEIVNAYKETLNNI